MPFLGHPFRVLLATAQTFALTHVVWTYGFSIGFGWGPSMLPTFLATNEWFVTDKRYRRGRGVEVGDCVVYAIPVDPGEEGLKRVLGMPGDYVLLNSPPSTSTGGVGVDRAGRGVGSENMIQVSWSVCLSICRRFVFWCILEKGVRELTQLPHSRYPRDTVTSSVTTCPGHGIVETSVPYPWLSSGARSSPKVHSPASTP